MAGVSDSATITVTVTDQGSNSNGSVNFTQQSFVVAVAPSHFPPVLTPATGGTLTFFQGQAPIAIAPSLTVTDTQNSPPDTTILSASVAFVNNTYIPNEDVLGFSPNPQNGITGTFNAQTGILNLSGAATLANYQAALNSVTYQDKSANPNLGGTAPDRTVIFTVNDGAATDSAGTAIWTISVIPVNVAPTLNAIKSPPSLIESTVEQLITVPLSGITAGGGNTTQSLMVQAVTDNSALIDPLSLGTLGPPSYTSPNTTGTLTFGILPNASGIATITVTVVDNGGTANGGQDTSAPQSFTVTVVPINAPPTIDPISPSIIQFNENDLSTKTVNLTGITAGGGAAQVLNVTATSSNPQLIPTPAVTYPVTNPTTGTVDQTSGFLTFAALPNISGTAVITVTVTDNGGTANGGVNTASQAFTVVVNPVNQPPTLATIANPAGDPRERRDAEPRGQRHRLRHRRSGPELERHRRERQHGADPERGGQLHQPQQTLAALSYTPTPNTSGIGRDHRDRDRRRRHCNGGVIRTRSFTVTVTPVNQQPQINVIPNPTPIPENTAGPLTINLSGITAGPGDQAQALTFTVTSSNTALIPTPTVANGGIIYTSPDTTGLLVYNPVANVCGQATITVTVTDNGSTTSPNVNSITRTFLDRRHARSTSRPRSTRSRAPRRSSRTPPGQRPSPSTSRASAPARATRGSP